MLVRASENNFSSIFFEQNIKKKIVDAKDDDNVYMIPQHSLDNNKKVNKLIVLQSLSLIK